MQSLPTKPCSEMSNTELAEFIEQGAWREGASSSDASAYAEAVKRLRDDKAPLNVTQEKANKAAEHIARLLRGSIQVPAELELVALAIYHDMRDEVQFAESEDICVSCSNGISHCDCGEART